MGFKFLMSDYRFSPYCSYYMAKNIVEILTSTDEWHTTIFPKEYPHSKGCWRVLYLNYNNGTFNSLLSFVWDNTGMEPHRTPVMFQISL